jgi:hypothetical protein
MIARLALLFPALCALLAIPALRAVADTPQNVSLANEFIRIVVNNGTNEAGRFSIDTTGGDPTRPNSKNQQLIYGGSTPWTSYSTVRIDNTDYVFGGPTDRRAGLNAKYGTAVTPPTLKDGVLATTYQYDDILVTQELSIVRGAGSRMLDTAGITYRLANQGKVSHQVGLRVLLDTKLGPNDGAPMRVGENILKIPTKFLADKLPDYWQAFDDLSNPSVISQGTYRSSDGSVTPPQAAIFADWGTLADEVWEPQLDPNQGFIRKDEDEPDTATAMFWYPAALDPGKSLVYATNYGIGYASITPARLTLGLTAQKDATFEYERTQPITITGYLKNDSSFDGNNVTLSLKLPEGLKFQTGSKLTQTIPTFKTGDELQASWVVVPTGSVSGNVSVELDAASDNIESNKTTWDVTVNVPKPQLVFTPATVSRPLQTNKRSTVFPVTINLKPSVGFTGARFTLCYDPTIITPLIVSRGSALVDDGQLLDGWEYDTSQSGKIVITAQRGDAAPLTQAETSLATISFQVLATGKCPLTLENAVLLNNKNESSPLAASSGTVEIK